MVKTQQQIWLGRFCKVASPPNPPPLQPTPSGVHDAAGRQAAAYSEAGGAHPLAILAWGSDSCTASSSDAEGAGMGARTVRLLGEQARAAYLQKFRMLLL